MASLRSLGVVVVRPAVPQMADQPEEPLPLVVVVVWSEVVVLWVRRVGERPWVGVLVVVLMCWSVPVSPV
jgi:hypothetical protein